MTLTTTLAKQRRPPRSGKRPPPCGWIRRRTCTSRTRRRTSSEKSTRPALSPPSQDNLNPVLYTPNLDTVGCHATSTTFHNPVGLSGDISGNLYVSDNGNNAIRMVQSAVSASTYTVSPFAGNIVGHARGLLERLGTGHQCLILFLQFC
jgi:hypothetical protein